MKDHNQYLFVQVGCQSNQDELLRKNRLGLTNACFGVIMCIVYYFSMGFIVKEDLIISKTNETDLISVDQFTVTGKIGKTDYKEFERQMRP
jgi:hypothetical protein